MKYILPIVCSLLLIGCSDSTPTEAPVSEAVTQTVSEPASQEAASAAEPTEATAASETVAQSPAPAVQPQTAPEPKTEKVVSAPAAEKVAPAVKAEKTAPAAQTEKTAPVQTAPAAAEVNGAAVFAQKCASCHGQKAEKSALGKSQVIAGWESAKVKEALHGYQAGTYGKEMKAMMQAQAKGLNDAQLEALAKHISTL